MIKKDVPRTPIPVIIPCRSGSVGAPHKNIRPLGGKPLMAWAIEAALESELATHVIVDTDDPAYALIAKKYGAWTPYLRPKELAEDVPTEDVLIHALSKLRESFLEPEILVCMQCTTPLVTATDIDNCIGPVLAGEADSAITVSEAIGVQWTFEIEDSGLLHLTQDHLYGSMFNNENELRGDWGVRQNFRKFYQPNGGVYVMKTENLLDPRKRQIIYGRCKPVVMSKIRSFDIDTTEDFLLLEALVKSGYLEGRE